MVSGQEEDMLSVQKGFLGASLRLPFPCPQATPLVASRGQLCLRIAVPWTLCFVMVGCLGMF